MAYTAATIAALDAATPAGATETISILDDAIRELKTVLKYQHTVKALVNSDSPYTALTTSSLLLANAVSGAITINLPTAVSISGRWYFIKKTDTSANAVTIDGDGSETINGETTKVLSQPNSAVLIVSNGTNWIIAEEYGFSRVSAKTADYTIKSRECNGLTTFTNDGDTGNIKFTLPAADGKQKVSFILAESNYILSVASSAGDTIQIGADKDTVTNAAYGFNAGDSIELISIDETQWVAVSKCSSPLKIAGNGYLCGGLVGSYVSDEIENVSFAFETSELTSKTLTSDRYVSTSYQSTEKGYMPGGSIFVDYLDSIEVLTYSTEVTYLISSAISPAKHFPTGIQSSTAGFCVAGGSISDAYLKDIDKTIFSTESSSSVAESLTIGRYSGVGLSSPVAGYICGGKISGTYTSSIEEFIYSSETLGTGAESLSAIKSAGTGVYTSTTGYYLGGLSGASLDVIESFLYSTEVTTTLSAVLSTARCYGAGCFSHYKGYVCGGLSGGSVIDDFIFNTETSSLMSMTLNSGKSYLMGVSHNV